MRVLVTDGDTRPALAITRSLGKQGHQVVVTAASKRSLASASRFCAAGETQSEPNASAEAFLERIAEIVRKHQIDLVLPVTELSTRHLAQGREALPPGCKFVLPSNESLAIANDKQQVLGLAQSLGIPTPLTRVAQSVKQAVSLVAEMQFPVVVKPAESRVRGPSGWISAGVSYAGDLRELEDQLSDLSPELFPVLMQERVIGPGSGVFALYQEGLPVVFFSHKRIREKPASGGVSVLCESVEPNPMALDYARRLLGNLRWHGVAMVEFKHDDRSGLWKLMEINGRFWGSLQLAVDSGVDFPALMTTLASGERIKPVAEYRVGVRSRWFLGDLDALLSVLLRKSARQALPANHPGPLRMLLGFMNFWRRGQSNEVFRLSDSGPGLLEFWNWLLGR